MNIVASISLGLSIGIGLMLIHPLLAIVGIIVGILIYRELN